MDNDIRPYLAAFMVAALSQAKDTLVVPDDLRIQTVTWDESECPVAEAIITTSQSINPESDNHSDQSELYSRKEWVDMPYCDSDVEAMRVGEPLELQE